MDKIESVQHVPFSLSKNKRNKRDSQRIETDVWSFDVFCLLEQQARLETKSGQLGSQGKPTQTTRLEKEGKHFFWTSFTGPYYNSFGDGYPSFGPAHPPAGPHPSLLLDLALSQTIPLLDRFSSFCPAASASQFLRQ